MNPYLKAFTIIAFLQFVANNVIAGALPQDPCALLKPTEIQAAVAPNANIGTGVPAKNMLPLGVECSYTWGPRTKEWGESNFTVTVIDGSKAWPGMNPALIEQGILLKVKTNAPNGSQISGVGDAAVFTFEARSSNGTAEAYFQGKGLHLSVAFHAGSALQDKEKIIALLKEAAGRL